MFRLFKMIIDLKRSIDLRRFLMSGAILISDDLVFNKKNVTSAFNLYIKEVKGSAETSFNRSNYFILDC